MSLVARAAILPARDVSKRSLAASTSRDARVKICRQFATDSPAGAAIAP
jgi:hypothetical protein